MRQSLTWSDVTSLDATHHRNRERHGPDTTPLLSNYVDNSIGLLARNTCQESRTGQGLSITGVASMVVKTASPFTPGRSWPGCLGNFSPFVDFNLRQHYHRLLLSRIKITDKHSHFSNEFRTDAPRTCPGHGTHASREGEFPLNSEDSVLVFRSYEYEKIVSVIFKIIVSVISEHDLVAAEFAFRRMSCRYVTAEFGRLVQAYPDVNYAGYWL